MFRKILVVYISVIVLAFSVLAFSLHVKMKNFLSSQRAQILNQEARELLPILEHTNGSTSSYASYSRITARYKQMDNVSVNLLLVKNLDLANIQSFREEILGHGDILNVSLVRRVLNGQKVQTTGPFSKSVNEATLILGFPIVINGTVVGALFLHTPVHELGVGQVTRMIYVITAPILLFSILILYLLTRRFSGPLLRMSKAVQAVGEGNFGQRIEITGHDEVGQLGQAFNEMAMRLERLEMMRKDLIANVSHEIRTPLTSVRGFIQGILEGVIPEKEEKQYLQTAFLELQRLGTILNTMLDLSAIETGKIQIHRESVRWADIVRSVAERVLVRTEEKGILLTTRTEDDSIMIWGDALRLTQVLFNVVDNAIRHTAAGEILIESTVKKGQLCVQIKDSGEGIQPDALLHIWERFYTGSASRTPKQSRSGLGLTITKHLVELMSGHISAESKPGQGTTITLLFPIFTSSSTSHPESRN